MYHHGEGRTQPHNGDLLTHTPSQVQGFLKEIDQGCNLIIIIQRLTRENGTVQTNFSSVQVVHEVKNHDRMMTTHDP